TCCRVDCLLHLGRVRTQLVGFLEDAFRLQQALDAELLTLVARVRAQLRQALRARGDRLFARRGDSQHRALQVEVAGNRAVDQGVERRIVELTPPARIGISLRADDGRRDRMRD